MTHVEKFLRIVCPSCLLHLFGMQPNEPTRIPFSTYNVSKCGPGDGGWGDRVKERLQALLVPNLGVAVVLVNVGAAGTP